MRASTPGGTVPRRLGARWRTAMAALVSGAAVGGMLVAVAAPGLGQAAGPLAVSLAVYASSGARGGPASHGSGGVATKQAASSGGGVLSAAQSRDAAAVRSAAAQVVAATKDAVAARARFSEDLAACDERHGAKACYEREGRQEVLRTSVDLREMSDAGSSWQSAERKYGDATQVLDGVLGTRKVTFSATEREPALSASARAAAREDTVAALSAFEQAQTASTAYRTVVTAVLGKDVARYLIVDHRGVWVTRPRCA